MFIEARDYPPPPNLPLKGEEQIAFLAVYCLATGRAPPPSGGGWVGGLSRRNPGWLRHHGLARAGPLRMRQADKLAVLPLADGPE